MRKQPYKFRTAGLFVALACTAFMFQSCELDDLTESLMEGREENYEILNKYEGELQVNERYADKVACFEIAPNAYNVKRIEFAADGSYHVEHDDQNNNSYNVSNKSKDKTRGLCFEADGKKMILKRNNIVPQKYYLDNEFMGAYVYDNGYYRIQNSNWYVYNNRLYTDGETESFAATPQTLPVLNNLSKRLSHNWVCVSAVAKIYNKNKLVETLKLSQYDICAYGATQIYFSPFGNLYRYVSYDSEYVYQQSTDGKWSWADEQGQKLSYSYNHFSYGQRTQILSSLYFSNNNLYIAEPSEVFAEDNSDLDGDFTAVIVYKYTVRDSYTIRDGF